ncbi:probable cardiolipin synthase (CMP-forming) [Diorhabda carinulata]|uniref:probable cardiolipin synthase (CMP-forming) n=1 Tax=Diorhabda carinulata TaxID=1163345 RepID=UPI0025A1C208|nr:probable cardiolipin synthase (CMP-forming) [Diorhabda carinulata]
MLLKPSVVLTLIPKWNNCCRKKTHISTSLNLSSHLRLYNAKQFTYNDQKRSSTSSNKSNECVKINNEKVASKDFKAIIQDNKDKFKDTEKRLKERGNILLKDIKETKNKVKEKVEEIIERENVYTIPNFLCVARIALTPYLGFLIVQSQFEGALWVMGIAATTDLLDGWIARTWKSQSSKMGSFLDPMADKILIGTLFLSLTYVDLIPLMLTGLIIARDVILLASGFVIRYLSLPPPRTISRYFDVTHATAQLAPTFISKVNTAVQLLLVGSTLAAPVFHYIGHPALEALWYITGTTTMAAGVSYILSKNTFKMLRKSGVSKR